MRRAVALALTAALAIAGSVAGATASASASSRHLVAMPALRAAAFADDARALPRGLVSAIRRDLGVSAQQYLLDGAAGAAAVRTVASLRGGGIAVNGSRIDGAALTVWVDDASDASVVEALGANAVVGEQPLGDVPITAHAMDAVYGGQGYAYTDSQYIYQCSVGFPGVRPSDGALEFLTAGHCFASSPIMYPKSSDLPPGQITSTSQVGSAYAQGVASSSHFGSGNDAALATIDGGVSALAEVATYAGGSGTPLSSDPLPITGESTPIVGMSVCKSGSRTGWSCGTVKAVDQSVQVEDDNGVTHTVNSVIMSSCVNSGDSGGAVVTGNGLALGTISAGSSEVACGQPNYYSTFFALRSATGKQSTSSVLGSQWQLLTTSAVAPTPSPSTFTLSAPVLSSAPRVGAAVTASTTSNPTATSYSYLWSRSGTTLSTASNYTPPVSMLGAALTVTITAHRDGVADGSASTTATVAAGTGATLAATVRGSHRVGARLTAKATALTVFGAAPVTAPHFTWLRDGKAVGASGSSYVQTAKDHGHAITVRATGGVRGFVSPTGTSTSAGKTVLGTLIVHRPSISGSRRVGATLTAHALVSRAPGLTLRYVWYVDGRAVTRAGSSRFRIPTADAGHRVSVRVVARASAYTTKQSTSAATRIR